MAATPRSLEIDTAWGDTSLDQGEHLFLKVLTDFPWHLPIEALVLILAFITLGYCNRSFFTGPCLFLSGSSHHPLIRKARQCLTVDPQSWFLSVTRTFHLVPHTLCFYHKPASLFQSSTNSAATQTATGILNNCLRVLLL